MLTLPTEISNNKDKVGISPMLFARFMSTIYFHAGTRAYRLDDLEGATDGSLNVVGGSGTFTSASATFQTWGVRAGDIIEITSPYGANYTVTSVSSETVLNVTGGDDTGSSRTWQLNMNFTDIFQQGLPVTLQSVLPESVNDEVSIGDLSLEMLDFISSLRSTIISSAPDLREKRVDLLFALAISSTNTENWLKVFEGYIRDYEINNNVLSLKLKSFIPSLNFPSTLLTSTYSGITFTIIDHDSDLCEPLQYGSFNYNFTPTAIDYSDSPRQWAVAPMVYYGSNQYKYHVAAHELHYIKTFSTYTIWDACFKRDGYYIFFNIYNASSSFTNTASGSVLTRSRTSSDYARIKLPPSNLNDDDNSITGQNAMDKDTSTNATITDTATPLSVEFNQFKEMGSSQLASYVGAKGKLKATAGVKTGTFNLYSIDPSGTKTTINLAASATTTHNFSPGSIEEIAEWEFGVENVSGGGSDTVTVSEIWIEVDVNPPTYRDKFIHIQDIVGREFSGTWNSRKTSGDPILAPNDAIESILRDELSYGDSDIDMDIFDEANTIYGGTGSLVTPPDVTIGFTIFRRTTIQDFLKKWNTAFQCSVIHTVAKRWRYIIARASNRNFSSSGTGTPGDEDIFTDTDTISDQEYSQHPLLARSIQIGRTNEDEVYERILLKRFTDEDEQSTDETETGTAGGKTIEVENVFIAQDTTVGGSSSSKLLDLLEDWLYYQKYIVKFTSFYNAIAKEVGDIINIQHTFLNDDMLVATKNTQKWMILEVSIFYHPNHFNIKAIELRG